MHCNGEGAKIMIAYACANLIKKEAISNVLL